MSLCDVNTAVSVASSLNPIKDSSRGPDAEASAAGSDSSLPAAAGAPAATRRVLVAEDDRTNRLLIRKMLSKFGWDADLVENGEEEAVKAFQTQGPYCLILMDINVRELLESALVSAHSCACLPTCRASASAPRESRSSSV